MPYPKGNMKSVSYDSSSLPTLSANAFCEEKKKFSGLRSDEQGGQATSPSHLIHRAEYVSFKKLRTLLEKFAGVPWCINNISLWRWNVTACTFPKKIRYVASVKRSGKM
ncbi:hypothetical protein TNCV_76401 [Trichonephila clavipes]|nr:hypothetical protein TNCV_76401 [Trichonephila clavipes]